MTPDQFRAIALALPEAVESAHMGYPDFRVAGKIFATLSPQKRLGMAKLTPDQQEMLCAAESAIFAPVPGGWGRRGSTHIRLAEDDAKTVESALRMAFRNVAPKPLIAKLETEAMEGLAATTARCRALVAAAPAARLSIRRARRSEAEAISRLIHRTLEETNAHDYNQTAIAALKANISVPEIERRMRERLMHVVTIDSELVGTISLSVPNARVHSVFVDPSRQGQGVGLTMMSFIEKLARRKGLEKLILASSLTAVGFYVRLGYEGSRRETRQGGVETVWMGKALRP